MTAVEFRSVLGAARGRRPRELADIARRELGYRAAAADGERRIAHAAQTGEPVLVGPFIGEVGFELLYWIPYLRRALRRHGIDRDQVTVLTRGGAGHWYDDIASRSVEVLDLISLEQFRHGLAERRARVGDRKLLTIDSFDAALLERAREITGQAIELHPRTMYGRLRPFWAGWSQRRGLERLLEHTPLARPARPDGLPERYVAVKAYFGDSLPDTPASRHALAAAVAGLREVLPVVLVTAGDAIDDHVDWDGIEVDAVVSPEPRANLAEQTAVVAHAELLVTAYGGFSYLGPLLDVPTLAMRVNGGDNPVHLETLRASGFADRFETVDVTDAARVMKTSLGLVEQAA